MKNLNLKLIIAILAISISFISCKKDEVDKESNFTLHNIVHKTDHGFIVKKGSSTTNSAYQIYLCSPDLNVLESGFSGYGDCMILLFVSNSPNELLSGDYNGLDNLDGLTIISYDSDVKSGVGYNMENTIASTAKITINGTMYEIEYSLTLTTGKIINGYYRGSLTELATSTVKSSKLYSLEEIGL
jgi:hypothetical protein